MKYAVFLITCEGLDQQVTNPLSFQDATDMAILLQADHYLEDPEFCGDIHGNFVVMPVYELPSIETPANPSVYPCSINYPSRLSAASDRGC